MPKAQIKLKPELKIIREKEIPHLLVPGEMGAVLELTVRNKEGKVTDHRIMRSKSFVRQFLELLWVEILDLPIVGAFVLTDILQKGVYIRSNGVTFDCSAGAADTNHGIMVGTGTTAPTIDDYVIETLIQHDAAPPTGGRMQYGDVAFGAPASDATISQLTITRDFANASGGAITVNEVALYVKGFDVDDVIHYFMTIRDVIGGGIAVPDGETLTVNYREQVAI